jgi:hypothetical protein
LSFPQETVDKDEVQEVQEAVTVVVDDDAAVVVVVSPEKPERRVHGREGGSVAGLHYGGPSSKRVKGELKVAHDLNALVWRPDGAVADALTTKLVNELVKEGWKGFSSHLIPFVSESTDSAIVSVRGGLGEVSSLWGLGLNAAQLPRPEDSFNQLVQKLFGGLLAEVSVDVVHSLNRWLCPCAAPGLGGFLPSTSPGNMFCSFFPYVNGRVSPLHNRVYQKEFNMENGVMSYNDRFWEGQKQFRNTKNGGKMVLMEVCAKIPEFLLKQDQKQDHRDAITFMNDHGCGVGQGFVKFTFYKGYVSAIVQMLTSPIVKKAKMYGFHPLFLLKNVLLANNSKYGIKGIQFVSVDQSAKTTILLTGFWRMKHDDPEKLEVIAVDADGTFITHSSVFD